MSTSSTGMFSPSPNQGVFSPSPSHKRDRSMLSRELDLIFNQLVEYCYNLKNYSLIRPLKGDARRVYGDYACLSVLEVSEELRNDPDLFDQAKPYDIAEKILDQFLSTTTGMNMINQESLIIRAAGIITFKLHGSWIAQRISNMLNNGIDTWAPLLFKSKARAVILSLTENFWDFATPNNLRANTFRQTLVRIFLYSGIDVRDATKGFYVPSFDVSADVETIRNEVCNNRADVNAIVNLYPLHDKEYIQKCFTVARETDWLQGTQLTCCGYRTLSSKQVEELKSIWYHYYDHHGADLAQEFGYSPDKFFGCLLNYTWLKNNRLVESTFNIDEMLDKEGNSLVYLLRTRALIRSLNKENLNSPGIWFKEREALSGTGERELGLHLVEFTEVIGKACKAFMPHIVCEYLIDLSKLFISYHREVRHGEAKVGLCKAAEVVMDECFKLLVINPGGSFGHLVYQFVKDVEDRVDRGPFFSDARYSLSRIELFTMSVSVSDPDFDTSNIFGQLLIKDTLGARADGGWTRSDANDNCYVSCFNHEWYKPLEIGCDSLIPLGDPSCRHSVPVASSIEVNLRLHAMSEDKSLCYLIYHDKLVEPLSEFWDDGKKTMFGTLKFNSDIGRVHVNFILLKEVVDTSLSLTLSSSDRVEICGSIFAYYGDVVKDDILGQYKATIFTTKKFVLDGEQVVSTLHRSSLAVPANGRLKIEALLMDVHSGKVYVNDVEDYPAKPGKHNNWSIKCGNFTFNLKVAWS